MAVVMGDGHRLVFRRWLGCSDPAAAGVSRCSRILDLVRNRCLQGTCAIACERRVQSRVTGGAGEGTCKVVWARSI